jgi:hypothetical protein
MCDDDCDGDGDGYWKNDDGDVAILINGIQIQDLCDCETLNWSHLIFQSPGMKQGRQILCLFRYFGITSQ